VHGYIGSVRDLGTGTCWIYFEELEFSEKGPDREKIPFEYVMPEEPIVGDRVIQFKSSLNMNVCRLV
jgi:hypothetical protein